MVMLRRQPHPADRTAAWRVHAFVTGRPLIVMLAACACASQGGTDALRSPEADPASQADQRPGPVSPRSAGTPPASAGAIGGAPGETEQVDAPELATETITFDESDASAGPTEPIGGIAPRRKKIESFELFGTRRGGPG
jgi:hypothetical protein